MAWIFPPEELIATQASVEASTVVIVDEIIKRMVFTPSPYVVTLFDTAEAYFSQQFSPVVRDSYFREYLSNGIPRERIYEIWSNSQRVKRGPNFIPRNTLISEYSEAGVFQDSCRIFCKKLYKAARSPRSYPPFAHRLPIK